MKRISGSIPDQTHRLLKEMDINFQAVISAAAAQIIGENTMYVACGSTEAGKEAAASLAKDLETLGFVWHNGFDWTKVANEERSHYNRQRNLAMDKIGAMGADLFVLLDTDGLARTSRGAYVELGLRLAVNKTVHYIGPEPDYFFHIDPLVQAYPDVEAFLGYF